ncbi:glycerol-3-phosphate dehydrogenase/oxidase [Thermomicrobium sp.]
MFLRWRDEAIQSLREQEFDLLVIGGGITAAGVAFDAAARGLRVALVEGRDFASGTSRWSTKLIHGGIRYLPQFDIGLVREALQERGRLLANAPLLVEPLLFLLPLYRFNRRPLGIGWLPQQPALQALLVRTGLATYDLLAGRLNVGRHRSVSSARIAEWVPSLRTRELLAAYSYYDARTEDARLVFDVLASAAERGAVIVNYARVVGFEKAGGRLAAAWVRDGVNGEDLLVRAKVFVNATGIWGEELERLTGEPPVVHIAPSKGVHLILPIERIGLKDVAVVLPETDDGRLLFVVPYRPYGDVAILGTTDTGSGPLETPVATDADIDYLLDHANRYFETTLTRADVISAYAGYRPLIRRGLVETTARLSRSHELIEHANGLISILGGKLTTFRAMAEETVDAVERRLGRPIRHVTAQLPLARRRDWKQVVETVTAQAREMGLEAHVPWLLRGYGAAARDVLDLAAEESHLARPIVTHLPYLLAEVVYATRYEQARHLDDVFERRTFILFLDWDHGNQATAEVSDLMARELGWSAEHRQREVERYRQHVLEVCGAVRGVADRLVPGSVVP